MKNFYYLGLIIFGLFNTACQHDEKISYNPQHRLSVSTDSVLFDTVFTSVGSTTRRFQIFNFNPNAIKISNIQLAGGNNSPFQVNINGKVLVGNHNLTVYGSDSVNVFVRVNINPNQQNQPFIVQDSIVMKYNGNRTVIPLLAYGQNAIFINNGQITNSTTWDSPLPYLVTNTVTIAENAMLTIKPGTRVFFHKDAKMLVKGALIAKGTSTDSILFASDRMERIYQEEPGQWQGIHFTETSQHSEISHAMIKNAIVGLQVDSVSLNNTPKLLITSSIIKNMQLAGLVAHHTKIAAYNNLFFNCGQFLVFAAGGGDYTFLQNTFAGYNFYFARRTPALSFSDSNNLGKFNSLQVSMTNNIVWGSLEDEISFEKKSNLPQQITLLHNLLKSTQTFVGTGNMYNTDPLFVAPRLGNFKLAENSPVLNSGIDLSQHPQFNPYFNKDLSGTIRVFPSELGCYEKN